MGGLLFIFEWPSKEAAEKILEANLIWIQQWFDDVKMWKEDGEPYVRLAWINFEGIPVLARNLNTVKLIAKDFGKLLEVGRLDFDVSVLQQVKALILVPCMEDINQVINVKLNGRKLEEEFVDPTIEMSDEDGYSGDHQKLEQEVDGYMPFHSPMVVPRDMGLEDLENDNALSDLVIPVGDNDKELDELLYSFQRIADSSNSELPKTINRKRGKSKYNKLVVGSTMVAPALVSNENSNEVLDESSAMKRIGKQIGFVFEGNDDNERALLVHLEPSLLLFLVFVSFQ
ncbi:hypothetical protein Tco_1120402 [Tanacetum coccineum]